MPVAAKVTISQPLFTVTSLLYYILTFDYCRWIIALRIEELACLPFVRKPEIAQTYSSTIMQPCQYLESLT